jgi:hypothetical protein
MTLLTPHRLHFLRVVIVTTVACFIGAGLLLIAGIARESAWPWTDRSPEFGSLHFVNESGQPLAWGWRYEGLPDWNWLTGDWFDGRPKPSRWRSEDELEQVLPGFPAWSGRVVEVHVEYPEASGHAAASASFQYQPGIHARLRAQADGQVFVGLGCTSWVGYATFGPERLAGSP